MKEWYLINPQPTLNSGFEYDEFADYARDGFDELLTETQLGKEIVYCKGQYDGETGLFETEIEGVGIVQSETPDAYTQGWKRQLLTRIGEISDFKYIKHGGKIWLIITEPTDNEIYDKCVLHQCNYVLKFQDKNKIVRYYPTVIENASQYNTGEEEDRQNMITLGYNQVMAFMSFDEITTVIDRNLRVFVDYNPEKPLTYKVTRPDTVSYSYGMGRVVQIVLTEDQFNPDTDSIEEMLCDYYPIYVPITIMYSGQPNIRVGGTKTVKVNTTDNITWSIETDIVATITPNGTSAKIKCNNDMSYVGKEIKVIATFDDGSTGECILTVTGGV